MRQMASKRGVAPRSKTRRSANWLANTTPQRLLMVSWMILAVTGSLRARSSTNSSRALLKDCGGGWGGGEGGEVRGEGGDVGEGGWG